MNTQHIVKHLITNGYSKKTLADELTNRGVKTNASTIWRILNSSEYQPKAQKVFELFSLYEESIAKSKKEENGVNAPYREE